MPRTIVITGGSDGIGAAAAAQLSAKGHQVVIVGRSPDKTRAAAAAAGAAAWFTADFTDLAQVRDLAAGLRERCDRIDVLANNAGGLFAGPTRTVDGFELTFQVNHLAGFLLTHLLLDRLLAVRGCVVNTSSVAARMFGRFDLDDPQCWRHYDAQRAYGNAKLANILFTRALHAHFHAQGLSAVAFHPGVVATNFAATTTSPLRWAYHSALGRRFMVAPSSGGANLAHFAAGQAGRDWISGLYYDNHRRPGRTAAVAADDAVVEAFWKLSGDLLGLTDA